MTEDGVEIIHGINPIFHIVKLSVFFVVLQSLFAWFLWALNPYIPGLISVLVFSGFILVSPSSFILRRSNLISIVLLILVQLYCVKGSNINGYLAAILNSLPIFFLFLLRDDLKSDMLDFITKGFSILLLISLTGWILFLIGIQLPFERIDFNIGQYWYRNYYFFLFDIGNISVFPRFSSVFLEPGHLGMITSFLLFANRFNINRVEVKILLVATILTFSLAGYLLLLISLVIHIIIRSNKPWMYTLVLGSTVIIGIILANVINGGDNFFNQLIVERLQVVDGQFVGNNRFSIDLNMYFDKYITSKDLWVGIGVLAYEDQNFGANAGYKVYLVQHGIVGLLLLFSFYFSVVARNRTNQAWFFFLIFIIAFIQRSYALWAVELVIFVTAISSFQNDQNDQYEEHKDVS